MRAHVCASNQFEYLTITGSINAAPYLALLRLPADVITALTLALRLAFALVAGFFDTTVVTFLRGTIFALVAGLAVGLLAAALVCLALVGALDFFVGAFLTTAFFIALIFGFATLLAGAFLAIVIFKGVFFSVIILLAAFFTFALVPADLALAAPDLAGAFLTVAVFVLEGALATF